MVYNTNRSSGKVYIVLKDFPSSISDDIDFWDVFLSVFGDEFWVETKSWGGGGGCMVRESSCSWLLIVVILCVVFNRQAGIPGIL